MAGGFGDDEPRTSVVSFTKEETLAEEHEREEEAIYCGRKKPSSYRQSRVRRDKNRPAQKR